VLDLAAIPALKTSGYKGVPLPTVGDLIWAVEAPLGPTTLAHCSLNPSFSSSYSAAYSMIFLDSYNNLIESRFYVSWDGRDKLSEAIDCFVIELLLGDSWSLSYSCFALILVLTLSITNCYSWSCDLRKFLRL